MTVDLTSGLASDPTPGLETEVAGVTLPSPVLTAAGCGGTGRELAPYLDLESRESHRSSGLQQAFPRRRDAVVLLWLDEVLAERMPRPVLRHEDAAEIGVAPVPGSSFYSRPELGQDMVRFAFCKTDDMLAAAAERLQHVAERAQRIRGPIPA